MLLNGTLEDDKSNVLLDTSSLLSILINSITCPFIVLLNALVIMAVKRRRRLQSNTNILLACLAATDVFTGLIVQPHFIALNILQLLDMDNEDTIETLKPVELFIFRLVGLCSLLHLMLVTCERLTAIRFTERYPYIVTKQNIKVAVIVVWISSASYVTFIEVTIRIDKALFTPIIYNLTSIIFISFVISNVSAYVFLYRETLRHRKMIKSQQLPQEEIHRFAKENRALKTTALVVSAVAFSWLPIAFYIAISVVFQLNVTAESIQLWVRTFVMLNSFYNPLIYCWRQKEMRQFVFRLSSPAVQPSVTD